MRLSQEQAIQALTLASMIAPPGWQLAIGGGVLAYKYLKGEKIDWSDALLLLPLGMGAASFAVRGSKLAATFLNSAKDARKIVRVLRTNEALIEKLFGRSQLCLSSVKKLKNLEASLHKDLDALKNLTLQDLKELGFTKAEAEAFLRLRAKNVDYLEALLLDNFRRYGERKLTRLGLSEEELRRSTAYLRKTIKKVRRCRIKSRRKGRRKKISFPDSRPTRSERINKVSAFRINSSATLDCKPRPAIKSATERKLKGSQDFESAAQRAADSRFKMKTKRGELRSFLVKGFGDKRQADGPFGVIYGSDQETVVRI